MPEAPVATVLFDEADLQAMVARLAGQIRAVCAPGTVLVAVLDGSLVLLADLVRALDMPIEVDFLAITTFAPDSGRVRIVKDLDLEVAGRDVVLVEDIVDTGLSLTFVRSVFEQRRVRSLRVCTLLDRSVRRILPVPVDFVGAEVPDGFVIGYGLGGASWYRNLPLVALADPTVLARDPGAYVAQFHGRGSPDPQVTDVQGTR